MNTRLFTTLAAGLITLTSACSTIPSAHVSTAGKSQLTVKRYVGSEPGFKVTSNLIVGESEAVLVDAQFTRSDANNVVAMIKSSGKNLKTVFITHGHPDHYFGIATLRKEFPKARYVASAETVADIKATGAGKLTYWRTMYGEELPDSVPAVDIVSKQDLALDGEGFILKSLQPGESEHASVLVVPSLKAAFVGDLAYDQVHLWLAEAVQSTETWKQNLQSIADDSQIENIYVGHQKVSRDNTKAILGVNREYIDRAVTIFKTSAKAEDAAAALKAEYADYSLPVIADLAAGAFLPAK